MTDKEAAIQTALGTLVVYIVGWRCNIGSNDLLGVFLTKETARDFAKGYFSSGSTDTIRIYPMTVGATDYVFDDEIGEPI